MFNKPNPKQNFFELEQKILQWWKENQILDKSIEQRPENNLFTFYDGPITANGEPHTGHMLTFSIKDIIPRYWTMKGYRVSRSLGWDCHGIPVEYEVEKKLGFKEKKDIEKFGVKEFNELCRKSVLEYRGKIIELEELMGRLTNAEEEYATMDSKFIESVWWSLKELYKNGKLYEGFKVVPYSTRAGTTLSNAEVALGGYKAMADPAITVKFQLKDTPDTFILAWTTTPWTIPGNLGLAIGEDIKYVKVSKQDDNSTYIVAKACLEFVFKDEAYTVLGDVEASELEGKEYIPPFDFYLGRENAHKIYYGSHVTTESGTGIVHLAPYGAEDNDIFVEVGIQSFDYLDEQGDFTEEIPPYAGMNYRDANTKIIEDLKSKNLLWRHEDYEHEMPMCWRTKTPLIYKPITSWYVSMSKMRKELVDNNNKVNWIPGHAKEGRFGNWLAEIKDWGISRKRYWGTPLPVWKSDSGKVVVIGSFQELEELSGIKIEDPHRPFIDEVTFEIDGEKYQRISDVIDVWYDSGAMPFARLHYPFENKEAFEKKFPAKFIAEGIDQTRGWFYTLHALGTSLFNKNAFENVIINGTIVDAQKRKLSKSLGNYTAPLPTIAEFGADTIRINFYSTPLMYGEDTNIDNKTLKETKQEFTLPLWNVYSYLTTYTNLHDWKPSEELAYNGRNVTSDEHPWDHIPFDDIENNLDAWVIARLQETIAQVREEMDRYAIPKAIKSIKDYIDDISKWYIRSSRDRFVDGDEQALSTLYYVLIETLKLLAPFAPFITEHIYRELVANHLSNAPESIHLCDYPAVDGTFFDEYKLILEEMKVVRAICEMGHVIRTTNELKVRQPLSTLSIKSENEVVPEAAEWMKALISKELNIHDITSAVNLAESAKLKVVEDSQLKIAVGIDIEITEELKQLGNLREIIRQIQALRKNKNFNMGDQIEVIISGDEEINSIVTKFENEFVKGVNAKSIDISAVEEGDVFEIDGKKVKVSIK